MQIAMNNCQGVEAVLTLLFSGNRLWMLFLRNYFLSGLAGAKGITEGFRYGIRNLKVPEKNPEVPESHPPLLLTDSPYKSLQFKVKLLKALMLLLVCSLMIIFLALL